MNGRGLPRSREPRTREKESRASVARRSNALVGAVINWLVLHGVFAWRQNNMPVPIVDYAGGRRIFKRFRKTDMPGLPDVVGIIPGGRALFVECKSGTGRLSPEQKRFMEKARACGALTIVARSVLDLEAHGHLQQDLTAAREAGLMHPDA